MNNGTGPSGRPRTEAASGSTSGQKLGEGLSQFLGKVLDQLSLTAWMPATMLVGNVAILTQLHSQRNLDIPSALVSLTDRPLGVIIVLLFSVLLATIITQAFQFDFIQILEGYWGSGLMSSAITSWRIHHYVKKRNHLYDSRYRNFVTAYKAAHHHMGKNEATRDLANELQTILTSELSSRLKTEKIMGSPMYEAWEDHCPAEALRKVEALYSKINLYPESKRVLPTRLGNVMRSSEDQVDELEEGSIQGFIMRNRKSIPGNLMTQHDQFRNRLDMYCSLVLVFSFLAIFGPLWLASNPAPFLSHSLGAMSLYGILAMVSYDAAIASAKGYGLVLIEIDENLKNGVESSSGEDDRGYLREANILVSCRSRGLGTAAEHSPWGLFKSAEEE